ncbi:hypothetical protein NSK_003366 [Nannochloropsis salina CCMP1776]|uniref:AMP-activated protein kinase glycogen-binding domain-containing protein n=1 Tax=Nannochloropsis salina CCMP1776 TaxID=1027361 RepID=A0A4D9D4W3_9STRA|nr:hypothetical protein NSK_003366 [Nannochloropsis salina CCMP1776]|eukprot:TFJ85407.1 hypothetical protein NSK_003366 [Nannochloropsis salina CCMP1776]
MGNFAGKDDSGEMRDGRGGSGLDESQAKIPPPTEFHHRREPGGRPGGREGGYGGEEGGSGMGGAHTPTSGGPGPPSSGALVLTGAERGAEGAGDEMAVDGDDREDDVVPTVFRWEHGGRQVYIQGTFNNWERQIPMHRSGNDFMYIHNLKRGKHAFKFIVDDEWRFAPDQLTVADVEGRINNFIDVTHFKPFNEDSSTLDIARKEEELYGTSYPDIEEYSVKRAPSTAAPPAPHHPQQGAK